jgi:hypothetical protein
MQVLTKEEKMKKVLITVIEANALGTPSVVYDVSGLLKRFYPGITTTVSFVHKILRLL